MGLTLRGVLCAIASICLLLTLIAAGFISKKAREEEEEASVTSLINSLEKNGDVTDLLWAHCRLELMRVYEAEDLQFNPRKAKSKHGNDIIWNSRSTSELDAKKLFKFLHPRDEHSFLDCLRKKKRTFLISGEDRPSVKWFSRYLDFVNSRFDASGRRELIQDFAGAPAPSPSAGSAAPLPSSRTIPKSQSHSPPSSPFFPRDISDPPPEPTISEKPSVKKSTSIKKRKANKEKTILIAVLVTALSTFIVSALLFLCFRRACGKGSTRKNDESPLLSLRLSDYSVASSHKSFALNNEKPSNQSFDTISNHNKVVGDTYLDAKVVIPIGSVAGITTMENSPPLNFGIAGMPPLKPPPGRTNSSITTIGSGKGAGANTSIPTLGPGKGAPAPPPPRPPPAPAPPPPPPLRPSGGPRPPVSGAPPPPPAPSMKPSPRPPPPPIGGAPPPRPPPIGGKPARPSPLGPNNPSTSTSTEGDDDAHKTKLKPFFWDKVMANPDQSMVWHQIKAGSFQFNEEMIETLFGYAPPDKNFNKSKDSTSQDPSNRYIQIIDPKKSQNLAILLKALNVTTEEVCDAIQEGNELPPELVQTLLKMAPTTDEELKLRLFSGDISRLGTAERFLKVLVDIPFAFRRLECLLFMCTLEEEETMVKDSFVTLEAACTDLRKSRLFLKLLEAVLKTGNRMNDGTFRGGAQAFKLDTLLKLSDVKGKDGKTTLLHFVVQEIIRSEGIRAARAAGASRSMSSIKSDDFLEEPSCETEEHYRSIGLEKVSGLSNELENVKRAAVIDADGLTGTVSRLGHALIKARDFLSSDMKNVDEEDGFHQTLRSFVQTAEVDIMRLLEEEKRIMALVKSTGDYFHGTSAKDEGLRLFAIVRDFLIILDKVCKEVKLHPPRTPRVQTPRKEDTATAPSETPRVQTPRKEGTTTAPSEPRPSPSPDPRQRLIPAIRERRMDSSSSDDDDDDP